MFGKLAGAWLGEKLAGRNKGAKGAILGYGAAALARRSVPTLAAAARSAGVTESGKSTGGRKRLRLILRDGLRLAALAQSLLRMSGGNESRSS